MCGIAGIVHFDRDRPVSQSRLIAMRDAMLHRGPDGAGVHLDGNVGLAHRRLAIIDLSENGHQPFSTPDGRFHMTYNGEIFNFLELRRELEKEGHHFCSKSDTEVLLQLFVRYGEGALEKLNGMFAFAIWDSKEKQLFLARDRMGIKPLYYAIQDQGFFFASEPKAILAAGVDPALNEAGFSELLLFKYIAGEATIFKNINRLLPGHCMTLTDGRLKIRRWWDLPGKIQTNREQLPRDPFQWFEETFYSSVQYRTISDVPVGVMLSGGLDSSSIAAALHHNGNKDLTSFTVTFEDQRYNEGPLAQKVAEAFGLHYHAVQLVGQDLLDHLEKASWYHDEPLVHQNDAQMLALARYAKQYVTVLLSGEGGDELMGGYFRYKPLRHHAMLQALSPLVRLLNHLPSGGIVNRFDKLSRYFADSRLSSLLLFNASNLYPADLKQMGIHVDPEQFEYRNKVFHEAIQLYPKEPARQAMYLDLFTHMSSVLDRNDRMTMGASIECRVPFLDYRLLEMIPALPSNALLKGKKGKFLLFNSVGQKLPKEVRTFKKLGFSVPWEQYMRSNPAFLDYIKQFEKNEIFQMPLFEKLPAKKIKKAFLDRNPVGETVIRQLFMLSIWKDSYFDKLNQVSSPLEIPEAYENS